MSDVLWRRLRYFLSPQMDIYKAIAPKVKHLSVLDVGCATGIGAMQFHEARSVTGIDIDADAIGFARYAFPGRAWEDADITRPITKELLGAMSLFDAAVMIECLEHIQDWRAALFNVKTLLAAEGKFYISSRNANADLRKNDLHEREWSAKQFKDALEEFFPTVKLYNYQLTEELDEQTHQTPLVAVCER